MEKTLKTIVFYYDYALRRDDETDSRRNYRNGEFPEKYTTLAACKAAITAHAAELTTIWTAFVTGVSRETV